MISKIDLHKIYTIGNILDKLKMVELTQEDVRLIYKKIGQKVKDLRNKNGVSQLDLALAIGFKSVSSVAKAESMLENKHFNIEHLYKISKAFNINMKYFFE